MSILRLRGFRACGFRVSLGGVSNLSARVLGSVFFFGAQS